MTTINIQLNAAVDPTDLCNLREAVGWVRFDEDYPAAFDGYWAIVSAIDPDNRLVGWCAVISDGVRHAVLLDVIVHPVWQRRGIGQRIVKQAVEHIHRHGINIIHVDFVAEHQGFYEACGFRTGLGGIYDG